MSDNKPRIGADSIPYLHDEVAVSSEDASYPVENAFDWRTGTKFKPAFDSDLMTNGGFENWTGGGAAAPDGWTLAGAGAAIAAEGTTVKQSPYSAKITAGGGAEATLTQAVDAAGAYAAQYVTLVAWIHYTGAKTAYLKIADGVFTQPSSSHTGGGSWEKITLVYEMAAAATKLEVLLAVASGETAYFDLVGIRPGKYGSGTVLGATPTPPALPEASSVRVYPCDGNLVSNWFFRDWINGVTSAPDGWTLTGAAATVLADEDAAKIDRFGLKLTRNGTDCYISRSLSTAQVEALIGKHVACGAWAKCSVGARAYVTLEVTATSWPTSGLRLAQAVHTGSGSWEWVTDDTSGRRPIPEDCTGIEVWLWVHDGDTSAHFDGVLVVEGTSAAQTPHSKKCDYLAVAGHNLNDAGTVSLHWSDDNWATSTQLCTTSPTDDDAFWEAFTQVEKAAYKLLFSGGTGKSVAEIGVVAFGERLELPLHPAPGFAVDHRRPVGTLIKSALGAPLGREIAFEEQRFRLIQEWVDRSDIVGDFLTWWTHAGTDGLPFFVCVQFSGTDVVRYVWCPDSAQFDVPLIEGLLVRSFALDCEGVAE